MSRSKNPAAGTPSTVLEPEASPAIASRIFIRNLPPSITEADFASHIHRHRGNAITDIRLLPRRRIAYVGYQSPQDAQAAVKYFNKSFIRMSRILVEIARDIPKAVEPSESTSTPQQTKSQVEKPKDDSKLKEYLELMQPSAANKRSWEDSIQADTPQTATTAADEGAKKRLRMTKGEQDNSDSSPKVAEAQAEFVQEEQEGSVRLPEQSTDLPPPSSDADWMRSRTTKLLGLLDDEDALEDQAIEEQRVQSEEHDKISLEPKQQPTPPRDIPQQEEIDDVAVDKDLETIQQSGRLFLRNLSYGIQDTDLKDLFSVEGLVDEVHIPIDSKTGKAKGIAFVQFQNSEDAVRAWRKLDGTSFQGRLLHVLPGAVKRDNALSEFEISKLPLKKQKQMQRRQNASSATFNWNSLYMNADAVVSSLAARLGVSKSDIIDPTSSDAAVKQAQAETQVIQDTKKYFESCGINLDSFSGRDREDNPVLVKNFPFGTTVEELKSLFGTYGEVSKVLIPPTGTIAVVQFAQGNHAKAAFKSLAYRKFKDSILYLERAPKSLLDPARASGATQQQQMQKPTLDSLQTDNSIEPPIEAPIETSTLYVRNLSFSTTTLKFHDTFKALDGFLSAKVMTKQDPKHPGKTLSMGYGFVEFRSKQQANAALPIMNSYVLDDHQLQVKASHRGADAAEERRKEDQTKRQKERKSKIIIKNLPFQATKKDVRSLFASYGQLRSIRVPKKFDNSRKGFAFAEFATPREAENAMDALRNTHLLGRRLVLEYAAGEAEDPEKEIERMQKKVGRQANSVALQRLTSATERRKFNLQGNEEE